MDEGWRSVLRQVIQPNGLTDVYQFGVYSGKSMQIIEHIYKECGVPIRNFFGFDSFEGLPEEKHEPAWQECWAQGEFDARKYFNVISAEDAMFRVKNSLSGIALNTKLIPGFFSESLTTDLVHKENLGPAHYIDLDVDIYTSCKEALTFMFSNGLVKPGTLISYDDWGGSPGWELNLNGESRAHKEIEEEYNVNFELVAQIGNQYPHVSTLFRVND